MGGIAGNVLSTGIPEATWSLVLAGVAAVGAVIAGAHLARRPGEESEIEEQLAPESYDNLPSDVAFVGRRGKIAELRGELLSSRSAGPAASPTLLLHGGGGMGKTAMAVHVAHLCSDAFPDGRFFLDMLGSDANKSPRADGDAVGTLLTLLGVDRRGIPADEDERVSLYRNTLKDRRCLIVLDDVRAAATLAVLRPASRGTVVIATSRYDLASAEGVTRFPMAPFDVDEAVDYFRALVAPELPSRADVLRTVDLVGRLPQGIRLAAGGLKKVDADLSAYNELLSDRRQRLDELNLDDLSARAPFAVTFERLDDGERQTFHSLGALTVLDYSYSTLAVASAMGVEASKDAVDGLVACAFLERVSADRLYAHDLLRIFAGEKAAESLGDRERAGVVGRVAARIRDRARENDELFFPDSSEADSWLRRRATAVAWFDGESRNLPLLIGQARDERQGKTASEIAVHVFHYYSHKRLWPDWERTHLEGVRAARENLPEATEDLMKLLCRLGLLRWEQGRYDQAVEFQEESLEFAIELSDVEHEGWVWSHLAAAWSGQGKVEQSLEAQGRAIRCFGRAGLQRGAAWSWNGIGDVQLERREFDLAHDAYHASLELFRSINDMFGGAIALSNCGLLDLHRERYDMAETELVRAVDEFVELDNDFEIARVRVLLARVFSARERWPDALDLLVPAVEHFEDTGMTENEAEALVYLARARTALGERREGRALLRRAEQTASKNGHGRVLAMLHGSREDE